MFSHWGASARPYVVASWGIGLTLVVSSLMVSHWVPLPCPPVGRQLTTPLTTDLTPVRHIATVGAIDPVAAGLADQSPIATLHVIYEHCPCSRRVLDHLLKRGAMPQAAERILLVSEGQDVASHSIEQALATGVSLADRAIAQGFGVEHHTPASLFARYGMESAPLMLVLDGDGIVVYSGGYSTHKQALDYRDVQLVQQILSGEKPESLPLFGCAVSKRLQQVVDPLRLKY